MTVARAVGSEQPETLAGALERAALDPEAGIRLLDRREQATWLRWSEIHARARATGGRLSALGLESGDRVGLIYPTGPELLEAFFGAVLAGAVPTVLPPPPRLGRLNGFGLRTGAMLDAIEARLILTDERLKGRLAEAVPIRPLGCRALDDLPADGGARPLAAAPEALAMIQFSSGTTLAPKPVALSHASVLAQARLLNSFWPDTPELVHSGVSWLPLYHDMGLIGCLFASLERPAELTLVPPEVFAARPAIWLRAISRFGATVSPATNFAYGYCVERIADRELENVDLSRWRVALNGAEPVSADVMRRFGERFARWGFRPAALTPVYGLAEASLAVSFSGVDEPFVSRRFARASLGVGDRVREDAGGRELVSVGRAVAGFEIAIRTGGDRAAAPGTVGRIWARGPTLMEGYLGRRAATRRVLRDGWLDTGDLGFLHAGELYVCGRAKELIIVRGRNHSPVEIEQVAEAVPGVRMGGAAAIGHLPEGADRERVLLFVERDRGAAAAAVAAIPEACRRLVLVEVGVEIDDVVVLPPDTIPRTSSGKVRRAEALRRYQRRDLG